MSARPDILNGHRSRIHGTSNARNSQSLLGVTVNCITHFQHVISLGPRCTNTSSVYKAQRKYAGPFDWIFSSPRIVIDCLQDSFTAFLDPSALYEVATVFDAIGLPPGSAPRDRKLVGHSRYSEMTEGVGRGVIFNHHNPLTEEGHKYMSRCAERLILALQLDEPKLYPFINIDRRLWNVESINDLFKELSQRDHGSFLMLAVNCIKNCGDSARQVEPQVLQRYESGRGMLVILEVQCVGENKGSYFQDPFDAQRIQALIVAPFTFRLSDDPLSTKQPAPAVTKVDVQVSQNSGPPGPARRWISGKANGVSDDRSTDTAQQSVAPDTEFVAESSRKSRWARSREPGHMQVKEAVQPTVCLRRGMQMPVLGFGTWQLKGGGECQRAVEAALQFGCTLVDTAAAYGNEVDVGAALRSVPRDQIFLVTKLQPKEHGDRAGVLSALRASLRRLGVDYVDLYLMHSPRGGFVLETWDAMLEARDEGLARAVGVSNFGVKQLEGLKACGRELPEANQIECHPWLQQKACAAWCMKESVAVMAYSPLARGNYFCQTDLARIAESLGCSEADAAIRWSLNKGFIVIPKSSKVERIKQNMSALLAPPLEAKVMSTLDNLDSGFQSCAVASNAMTIPWERIAERADAGKSNGKGKSKSKGKGYNGYG